MVRDTDLTAIAMTSDSYGSAHPRYGSLAVATPLTGEAVQSLLNWRAFSFDFWDGAVDFWDRLGQGDLNDGLQRTEPSPAGEGRVASLGIRLRVDPDGDALFPFVLAWHTPNRTRRTCGWTASESVLDEIIGNHYATRFG